MNGARWTVGFAEDRGLYVQDEDFRHDARLYINGDFKSPTEADAFAAQVAFALNKEFGWDMADSNADDEMTDAP